ncbi:uncharacterized protein LOC105845100 isoform X2 [Hydra vulgaris]|uniref:uncharacterized protein LOC105845100 isoform X2 n=1 Tax=Hydra vulgaris TaxID=6087 RepID=UPI001F5E72D2|nr:uncharacterized protein LOC105845100 isoform X2 [Hydra vulgaris]
MRQINESSICQFKNLLYNYVDWNLVLQSHDCKSFLYTHVNGKGSIQSFINFFISLKELFALNEQRNLSPNQLLTTFNVFPIEYEIAFETCLTSFTAGNSYSKFSNLFDFTTGNSDKDANGLYSYRVIGMWFDAYGKMLFFANINGAIYNQLFTKAFTTGCNQFVISQLLYKGYYNFTINIGGMNIFTIKNVAAKEFKNVKMYFSDPWYIAQSGYFKNLLVTKRCSERNFYCKPPLKVTFDSTVFSKLGCWGDTQDRALVILEGKSPEEILLYHKRTDPLSYCYKTASNYGYRIFALQNGGQCFAGNNASYQKFGVSNKCYSNGRGGPYANEVYTISNNSFELQNEVKNIYALDISFHLENNDSIDLAFNVTWEYLIPPFIMLQSESSSVDVIKINSNNFKYKIFNLTQNEINQSITVTINNTQCLFGTTYSLDIPINLYFENAEGRSWDTFKKITKQLNCSSSIETINPNRVPGNCVPEYYGRGIYSDNDNLQIYVCMNQFVKRMRSSACFISKDDGIHWQVLDPSVGAVLGHHILSGELYAIHRNQKSYLKFNKTYKKWLAVTNRDFEINISKNLNWTLLKTLEGNYDQVVSFGTNQWMGNENGLYFRKFGDNIWIQRINWSI